MPEGVMHPCVRMFFFPQQPLWSRPVLSLTFDTLSSSKLTRVVTRQQQHQLQTCTNTTVCQFEQRGCCFPHLSPKSSNWRLFVLWALSGTLSGSTSRQRQNRNMKQRLSLTTLCPLALRPAPVSQSRPFPLLPLHLPLFFLFSSPSKVHMNCCCGCCCECVWDCSTSVTFASEESQNTTHLPFPLLLPHCCKCFFSTGRRCREPAFLHSPCVWVYACGNVVLQRLIYGLMWSPAAATAVITSQPQTSHLLQREPLPSPLPPLSQPHTQSPQLQLPLGYFAWGCKRRAKSSVLDRKSFISYSVQNCIYTVLFIHYWCILNSLQKNK